MRIIPNKIKPILLGSMLLIGIVPAAIYNSISSEKLSTVATQQIANGLSHRTALAAHSLDGVLEQRMLSIQKLASSPVFQLAHEQALSQGNFIADYLRESVKVDPALAALMSLTITRQYSSGRQLDPLQPEHL